MLYFFLTLSLLFLFFAILVIIGKGDMLIAGYNTASEQQRMKMNIKRVRIVVSALLVFVAIILPFIEVFEDHPNIIKILIGAIVAISLIDVILINTWCKNKTQ
ncbi:MAG: DUF3784 domain-containing protein [Bacteroidaceae bacterium]|nr:DUF3784 domain-containing protein [Bacteroidaceae bacterium]